MHFKIIKHFKLVLDFKSLFKIKILTKSKLMINISKGITKPNSSVIIFFFILLLLEVCKFHFFCFAILTFKNKIYFQDYTQINWQKKVINYYFLLYIFFFIVSSYYSSLYLRFAVGDWQSRYIHRCKDKLLCNNESLRICFVLLWFYIVIFTVYVIDINE